MGMLIDGKWHDKGYDAKTTGGKFVRRDSVFRNWITADGSAGPTGMGGYAAETDRYHLYVANACPWAHRTMIFRNLKGLEDIISVSVVDPLMLDQGWVFSKGADSVNGADYLHQVYTRSEQSFSGRVTVPVMWDKKTSVIVNNESSEIIRMFNTAFDGLDGVKTDLDYYPLQLRAEIDEINERVYATVNNGVYRAGFASTQSAYEEAVTDLFESFDWLEERLSTQRYLAGDQITEADWRLFATLVRFDPVYGGHFKCNIRRLVDYENLWNYTRELYQISGVAATVNMDHIKSHYYGSHESINPSRIVPSGPEIDYAQPHGRG